MPNPIDLQTKLSYLSQMFTDSSIDAPAYEDAAGHLCDLLEFCRQNIVDHNGRGFMNLEAMVKNYGEAPIPIVLKPVARPTALTYDVMSCDHWRGELNKLPPGARVEMRMGNDPPDNLSAELVSIAADDSLVNPGTPVLAMIVDIIDTEDEDRDSEED